MSEITKRLQDTSANCIQSYEGWSKDMKNESAREELLGYIHELRKVASRLEIEIAMSERDQMKSKRIPIPPHRSSQKKDKDSKLKADIPANSDEGADPEIKKKVKPRGRKPKSASGNE